MNNLPQVTIYTDGACLRNPGPGGYAALLVYGDRERELSGGYLLTTNNRMEVLAAIRALESLKRRCCVTVYSDSRYLVDTIEQGWRRGANADLWARLLELCRQHAVRFVWVRGHAGHAENERCDRLATEAARQPDLPPDEGYAQGHLVAAQPTLFDGQLATEE
jgi:ribonuclease HI